MFSRSPRLRQTFEQTERVFPVNEEMGLKKQFSTRRVKLHSTNRWQHTNRWNESSINTTNKETANKRGRGVASEYYGSPSYDGHMAVLSHTHTHTHTHTSEDREIAGNMGNVLQHGLAILLSDRANSATLWPPRQNSTMHTTVRRNLFLRRLFLQS
jgi:hypothetical protein